MPLSPHILAQYVVTAGPILQDIARRGETITYTGLMRRLGGPGRGYIGEVLGRISEIEFQAGRPKLSSVVVRSDTEMVSGGFFGLPDTPQALRRATPEEWQNPYLTAAEQAYWRTQLDEVYRYWQARGP